MDENFRWLLRWFYSHCDGRWEREEVVSISTLDNPGWNLTVRTLGIEIENRPFHEIYNVEWETEHNWIACFVRDGLFQGGAGPFNFAQVLRIFKDWAEGIKGESMSAPATFELTHTIEYPPGYQHNMNTIDDDIMWLTTWFYSQCDTDWEHSNGIRMHNTDGSNWYFRVGIDSTALMDCPFQDVDIRRSEDNWVRCSIRRVTYANAFEAYGGPFNLPEMIRVFRTWAQGIYAHVGDDKRIY